MVGTGGMLLCLQCFVVVLWFVVRHVAICSEIYNIRKRMQVVDRNDSRRIKWLAQALFVRLMSGWLRLV